MISFEDLIRKFSLKKGQACLAIKVMKRKQDLGRPVVNEEHIKARNSVSRAIIKGEIKRPSICHACFVKCKPDAHHPDYNRPFLIQWLCRSCHIKNHEIMKIRDIICYNCYN